MSSSAAQTDTFTAGIATCPPSETLTCGSMSGRHPGSGGGGVGLPLHRHAHAELYYVISGVGIVTINGAQHPVGPGSVVFIPADAEHGVCNNGDEDLTWLFVFAAEALKDIVYQFSERGIGDGERIRGKL